ncbi:MAG: NAD-glutamate dehydrogenase [Acidimicrobiales bacterium]
MATDAEPTRDLLDEVSRRVRARFDAHEADQAEELVRRYYSHVAPGDLTERTPSELYGAAISHLQAARRRTPGEPVVRVYDPTTEDDGWHSPHTVIDVVTDDAPFIVASLVMAVESSGLDVHLVVHPVLSVRRDDERLVGPGGSGPGVDVTEAFVHLEIDRVPDASTSDELARSVRSALDHVQRAVSDWQAMSGRAERLADQLESEVTEHGDAATQAAELLRWMAAEEFIFLGARDYRLDPAEGVIHSIPGSGLGILSHRPESAHLLSELPPEGATRVLGPDIVLITKTNARSPVHRPDPMDYVGIRHHDPDTGLITERRFIGLFTSRAYTETVTRLPLVRHKAAEIVLRAGFSPGSHDANRLVNVIEEHPRDELFQASVDELLPTVLAIVGLYERHHVRLFVRHDSFGRSVSCIVYVPRDRFRTEVREAIQRLIEDQVDGETVRFEVSMSSSSLARLYLVVSTPADRRVELDVRAVEQRLERSTRTWSDGLTRELVDRHGEGVGLELAARWAHAFPAGYREDRTPDLAVADIDRLEALAGSDDEAVAVRTYHPLEAAEGVLHLKLYRFGRSVRLSSVLPLLQDHGVEVLDEHPYQVTRADGRVAWIHDFGMLLPRPAAENMRHRGDDIRSRLEHSVVAAWYGRCDSDRFNELVLLAGLTWREVTIVRALAHYLRQIGTRFAPSYVHDVVTGHSGIARLLVDRFHARFDPDRPPADTDAELSEWIVDALDTVASLDEDRILRGLHSIVEATVRTNAYQRPHGGDDDDGPDHLVLKLDPSLIPEMPRPVPAHEILVFSPRVEGVHLRAGRVARGGLRWSDRREDYRTEVLGLMKAQVVKNAVIVPTGAKGGFVCRQLPPGGDPAATRTEVEACYRAFVGGLLDVTDDLVDGTVVPPHRVVRHDGDDPYLVVAADKGTATFSDLANSLATERGFWLDDAFASGGSTGYDHKEMGITARGAWVSVRRHLAELGIDVEHDDFTVAGIGDMSGDVFGNGMLLSRHIRLVAAFDHRHVFVDPDPDPETSFEERRRLFELPRSSWADYDRSLLSPGGLVVPRSAKAVAIDERTAAVLGCEPGTATPSELISAILSAPVDLLWNGGIGTYVKASWERHDQVGDRSNDAVRVDADALRCRVVAEGGNLGLTQPARVEAALGGVRLNTDAIDNSAGVDCSDHEVNLKVLLDQVVAAGDLTVRQRNELLLEMTDDVATHVLSDNEAQTLALASARIQAPGMVHVHARHLAWLERAGGLERDLEALPTDEELAERENDGRGLTQPELAVLMAYTKNVIAAELLDSDLPDDPQMAEVLTAYLPPQLVERFPDAIDRHPLRRELVATELTNRLVNKAGVSMTLRLNDETAASIPEITRSHLAAWRIHALDQTWAAIEALPAAVAPAVTIEMFLSTKRLGERATRWLIRNRHTPLDVAEVVNELAAPVQQVVAMIGEVATPLDRDEVLDTHHRWVAAGVPDDIAMRVAVNDAASTALDIVDAAHTQGAALDLACRVYFLIEDRLGLGWLRSQIDALPRTDKWATLARTALRDDLHHEHAAVVRRILATGGHDDAETRVDRWVAHNETAIDHTFGVLLDIRATGQPKLDHLSVGLREVRNLVRRAGNAPIDPESR